MADRSNATPGYGTVEGVFVPTLLTILGVILFLRTGWVVGNAGLLGGLAVILLSYVITGATALSLSSVATNVRIGGGGAYAVIGRSLGPEVGGAIGIPLYLSQTLVIALYLFGFRDGWQRVFPDHSALLIDLAGFVVLVAIALVSARFAFRVQYLILALVVVALGSMALGAVTQGLGESPSLFGSYPGSPDNGFAGTDFWTVFAVFFPATTGIMAGANLSGELADSRRSIPRGTLLAVAVSLVVYVATAVWLAFSVPEQELTRDYLAAVQAAAFGPAVIAGLLGATFSSALASTVGAPRILQALAADGLLPRSSWLAARSSGGEPRHALMVTIVIALVAVGLRSLNALAPVITLFFLITYGTINLAVLVEQALDLPSFRPQMRLPMLVPAFGVVGCLAAMFIVNPAVTVLGLVVVAVIFGVLVRRQVESPYGDVRSEVFRMLARWANERARSTRAVEERSWRPHVLVPIDRPHDLRRVLPFLSDVAQPQGSLKLVGHGEGGTSEAISRLGKRLRAANVEVTCSVVEAVTTSEAITAGAGETANGTTPNIVFLGFPESGDVEQALTEALDAASAGELGVIMLSHGQPGRVGGRGVLNLWVRPQPPGADIHAIEHSHLAMLMAIKLQRNWGGQLNLLTVVERDDDVADADRYLHALVDAARLPGNPAVQVMAGEFTEGMSSAPVADAQVLSLGPQVDFTVLRRIIECADSPCVFVRDSGSEDVMI